jgi:hypothetical protein
LNQPSSLSKDDVLREYRHRIPNSLDDVIKLNRDVLKLEHVELQNLKGMDFSIPITNLKGILTKGFVYKSIGLSPIRTEAIWLVGYRLGANDTSAVHTSRVIGFDHKQSVFLTQSGSHYVVNEIIKSEPEALMLMHICNFLHKRGGGEDFGIPFFPCRDNPKKNLL